MDQWHNREHKITASFSNKISDMKEILKDLFQDCDDVIQKEFVRKGEPEKNILLCYIDGLSNRSLLEESIIRPFLREEEEYHIEEKYHVEAECTKEKEEEWILELLHRILETADVKQSHNMDEILNGILSGDAALFANGCETALIISSKGFPVRGISEPESEVVLRGSKDSFNENLRTNTALIRRRIKDTRLKVKQKQVGYRSRTNIALLYIDDLVEPGVVERLEAQIDEIVVDGIFDNGMLEHLLEKKPFSPFPQYQHTERPDKASSGIMEGRVAVVVDNSPGVLLLPVTIHCFFQASDDYYNRFYVSSLERCLRYLAAFIAIGVPGLYIALFNFHTEVLPTSLVLSFASARLGVPFPVVIELLLMELSFEMLREAGVRMPGQMGNTIGVVGGLIVGQAAVEAGLVSTIAVIVVSLTAIASFSIPNESFTSTFRLLKFVIMGMCALWGIYGFFIGLLGVFIHLCSLNSYGIPYLMPSVSSSVMDSNTQKDYIMKWPIRSMVKRPIFTRRDARIRMRNQGRKK